MSENLVHTAVVDDCLTLIRRATDLHPAFVRVVEAHPDTARLGGITRFGDRHNPGLLGDLREDPDLAAGSPSAHRLAFVIGWLSHRAADRNFKQVFRALDPHCPQKPTDCSVYHDVTVLREVYGLGQPPFDAALLAEGQDGTPLESLGYHLMQRALIGLHTLTPHPDVGSWIDHLVKVRTRFTVDLRRYGEAFHRPDPDKVRRFLTEPVFYDATDGILVMARAGAEAGPCDPWSGGEPRSLYGKAVARAYAYVQAASAYFARAIDLETLNQRLDIGKPEVPAGGWKATQAAG